MLTITPTPPTPVVEEPTFKFSAVGAGVVTPPILASTSDEE